MELTCPKCHGTMRTYERNGVHVDQCTECRGIFLDRGELERLIDAENDWHERSAGPAGARQHAAPSQHAARSSTAPATARRRIGRGLGAVVNEVISQVRQGQVASHGARTGTATRRSARSRSSATCSADLAVGPGRSGAPGRPVARLVGARGVPRWDWWVPEVAPCPDPEAQQSILRGTVATGDAASGEWIVRRWIHVLVSSVIAFTALAGAVPAAAVDPSLRSSSPSVFGVGDSLIMQCGRTLGLGTRSTGIIGWGGATSTDLRTRLRSTTENWPYVTEASHAEEVADWKAASTWVIGLGTNDVVRNTPVATFRANVDWFMARAAGRPVLWFNLHSPLHQKRVDTYNIALAAAAKRYPNLVILNWARYAKGHPEALRSDGVHLTDFDACRDGRFALAPSGIHRSRASTLRSRNGLIRHPFRRRRRIP